MWAKSAVRPLKRKEDEWEKVKVINTSMEENLPEGWALEFSGVKVQEMLMRV
jgi:hypothetical protein